MRNVRHQPISGPLAIGEASVRGEATAIRRELYAQIGVSDRVLVKLDRAARRLGFTRPVPGGMFNSQALKVNASCLEVRTATAVRSLGLVPSAVAGRYPVEAIDGVLWVKLEERNTEAAALERITFVIDAALQPLSIAARSVVIAQIDQHLDRYRRSSGCGRFGRQQ